MINSHVVQISSYINPITKFGKIGKIHSIFTHSINIQIGYHLVNIGCFENYLSCFGMNIPENILQSIIHSVGKNEIVKFSNDYLYFYTKDGIKKISLVDSNIVDLKINVFSQFPKAELKKVLKILERKKLDQRIGLPNNSLFKTFTEEMTTFKNLNIEQVVTWLLGRGKGLTPSGDDILCGYIFILLLVGKATNYLSNFIEQILSNLSLTTDVSKAYLVCATQGYVNSKVYQLYESLKNHDLKNIDRELNSILNIGHTSGNDLSYGIELGILASLNTPESMKGANNEKRRRSRKGF